MPSRTPRPTMNGSKPLASNQGRALSIPSHKITISQFSLLPFLGDDVSLRRCLSTPPTFERKGRGGWEKLQHNLAAK